MLVWAYRDEMVHAARPEGVPVEMAVVGAGHGSDVAIERIDSSVFLGFEAAPDAYAVHLQVRELCDRPVTVPAWSGGAVDQRLSLGMVPALPAMESGTWAQLVIGQAIAGRAPDWYPDPVLTVRRGELIYKRHPSGKLVRDDKGSAVEQVQLVSFEGDMPWSVVRARAIYGEWVTALRTLRDALIGRLTAHDLTGALPPRTPWA